MKKIVLFSSLGLLFVFASCKTRGCTDDLADNFDSSAELGDESCEYTTDMIFYLNSDRKTFYDDKENFFAPFHLYIDGQKIGEISVSSANFQTYETAPECGATTGGVLNHSYTSGNNEGNVTVTIQDQLGNSHGSVSVNVDQTFASSGKCKTVLL